MLSSALLPVTAKLVKQKHENDIKRRSLSQDLRGSKNCTTAEVLRKTQVGKKNGGVLSGGVLSGVYNVGGYVCLYVGR